MKRIVTLVMLIAALGAVSVQAANADVGINLCVGCTAPQSAPAGSMGICTYAGGCPQWFPWAGYIWYGPLNSFTRDAYGNPYEVQTYWGYTAAGRFIDYYDCYYYMSVNSLFLGCYWR